MGSELGFKEKTHKNLAVFKDLRRYYCEYCAISRSKKSLLASHLFSHHKDEMNQKSSDGEEAKEDLRSTTCEDCGATFRKPSYLRQHMLSHSLEHWMGEAVITAYLEWISIRLGDLLRSFFKSSSLTRSFSERPFTCPLADCHSSYRRKDHLNRHLLQHQGKLFECPVANCGHKFSFQGNMKRHVHEFHEAECSSCESSPKQYVCLENGCGKVFKYASKLHTHEASHVKLNSVEVFCSEPGCLKPFTNKECLKAHIDSCHRYIHCEICGNKQLKKNIKRHLRTHEIGGSSERIKCRFKGCLHTFSNKSNLQQHVKAVHFSLKPFICRLPECEMRFSFKHVRDKHEKSACHVYTHGDFEETDEQFRSRPRGGIKRKCPTVEALIRKRIAPPNLLESIINQGSELLSWMLSEEEDGQH